MQGASLADASTNAIGGPVSKPAVQGAPDGAGNVKVAKNGPAPGTDLPGTETANETARGTGSETPRWRAALGWATVAAWAILLYLSWRPIPLTGLPAPDWTGSPDVTAPLTRKLLFYHPASAWASFLAYTVVLGASIAYLNERQMRFDRAARAAAHVGLLFNTIALVTGTLWGIQEWSRTGQTALATVYTDPKVLVVVVLWLAFLAYLLVRRLTDQPQRRARMAAAVGILGFLGVPLSWVTSQVVPTSLHPDLVGPGADPEAAVSQAVGIVIAWSMLAFALLFAWLWRCRLDVLHGEARLEDLELGAPAPAQTPPSGEVRHAS